MNKKLSLIHIILLVSLLVSCSKPTPPPPTETPLPLTSTNTPLPTATSTSTLEPTATSTEIPTATPTATRTPFPSLTPLPPGFYANYDAGFAFSHPTSWKLDNEDSSSVTMESQSLGMMTWVFGYPAVDPSTGDAAENIDTVAAGMAGAIYQDLKTTYSPTFLVKLGNEIEAPAKDLIATSNDVNWTTRVVFHTQNFRSYIFIFFATSESLRAAEPSINRLLESVQLFSPQPFGLPKDHNLILAGYDPEAKDLAPASTTGSASDYVGLLFTGLVRLNPDLAIEPDLAESWEVSPDGTVYTFTLREGLQFADGSELTVEDVIYSWERAADPDTESPTAGTYLGDILGFQDRLDGKADTITGLQAVDDRTLVVTLDAPKPYFLAKLTYPTSFVVDKNQVEHDGDNWPFKANASGAYVLKEYKETEVIVFERNPRYHAQTAIQYVTYILNPGGSWISRYEDGTLDMLGLDIATTERVRRPEDPLHAEWLSGPSLCTTFVALNNTIPPFDDPLVRQAFVLAVDRDTLVERLSNNLNIPALTLLPPSMPGFSDNLGIAFDSEAAKKALDDSMYAGNLPEIILETSGYATEGSPMVDALADMWQKTLNVKVKVSFLDPQKYTEAAVTERGQMTLYGWCADYPDPQNFMEVLFRSDSKFNTSGYSNPVYDELMDRAGVEIDPVARLALYHQAEALLLDDYGIAPLQHGVSDVLVKPRLQGYVLSPIVNLYLPWLSLLPENP
jgi:oligopeptide transport system substrate-binding protein